MKKLLEILRADYSEIDTKVLAWPVGHTSLLPIYMSSFFIVMIILVSDLILAHGSYLSIVGVILIIFDSWLIMKAVEEHNNIMKIAAIRAQLRRDVESSSR